MEENKIIAFLKANYVWILTLFVLAMTFIGLAGSIVTTKGVSVTYIPEYEWYEVTKISSREGVNLARLISEGTITPFITFYGIVIASIALVFLGKYVHHYCYIAATLLLACVAILFLTGNTFYDLALCNSLANEPNLLEDLQAVSETKLSFGTTFASILCFAGALLCYTLANIKDSFKVSDMAEIGIFSAMAIGLQFIKIPVGITGGSINLGLIPLFIIALRHGPVKGFMASGFVYGLITCITDGYGFNTYPFDYLIGFGGVAALGFFKNLCFTYDDKGYNSLGFLYIALGVLLASVIRFFGSSFSSMVNYGYTFKAAVGYNVGYVFITGGISLVAMEILYIPLAMVNRHFPVK